MVAPDRLNHFDANVASTSNNVRFMTAPPQRGNAVAVAPSYPSSSNHEFQYHYQRLDPYFLRI